MKSLLENISEIVTELDRAESKFPDWPTDPIHALAIVGEEYGETLKELVQLTYEPGRSDWETVRKEAVQLAAMTLRFYKHLDTYTTRKTYA